MHKGMGRGRAWGGAQQNPEPLSDQEAAAWFAGRLPDGWFTEAPEATVDREEILVVGTLWIMTHLNHNMMAMPAVMN